MANKLNYQQSREIRKTKFSDLFLDTLARKETGVLGSVGKAISLNAQARMKGIKEKFDPLNIVKFLTFGSKLGPALYGKMAGRDQKDIDYFTGRSRHITGGRNTADKIKGKGGGDNEGINEQLAKIFTFLKSSREDDVKLKQQAKNSEEEINMEKDRRHKELLKTLEKLMKQIGGGSATATKEKEGGLLDGLTRMIEALKAQIQSFIDDFKNIKSVVGGLSKLTYLANPYVLAATLVAAGIFAIYNQKKEIREAAASGDVEKLKGFFSNPGGSDEADAYASGISGYNKESIRAALEIEAAKGSTKAQEALDNFDKLTTETAPVRSEKDLMNEYLSKKGFYDGTGKGDYKHLTDSSKKPTQADFDAAKEYAKSKMATPVSPAPVPDPAPAPKAPPTSSPVPAPASAPVSNLTNTNVALNLPSDNSGNSGERMSKTNNVAMNSRSKGRSGLMPSQISVRNEEPTYNELIAASTRMI